MSLNTKRRQPLFVHVLAMVAMGCVILSMLLTGVSSNWIRVVIVIAATVLFVASLISVVATLRARRRTES